MVSRVSSRRRIPVVYKSTIASRIISGQSGEFVGVCPHPSGSEQPADFARGEEVRPDGLMQGWEEPLVRDKAARLAASPIQTRISDLTHVGPTIAGGQMLKRQAPLGERLRAEIGAPGGEESIEMRQDPFVHRVLSPQGALERQIAVDRGGQSGAEGRGHDATSVAPQARPAGRSNETSRRSSTARRR